MEERLYKLVSLIILLVTIHLSAAGSYHVLIGGKAGYQMKMLGSSQLDSFVDNFNSQINRKLHSDNDGSPLEKPDFFHGYYFEYSIYKYLNKESQYLWSSDLSCGFDYQSNKESWEFFYQNIPDYKCSRDFETTHWSLGVDYSMGISPYKNLILSGGAGLSYEKYQFDSKLSTPSILPSGVDISDVQDFENNRFTMDDPESQGDPFTTHTDSTSMQNGNFTGNGFGVKLNLKGEYFFTNNLAMDLSLNYKFSYFGNLRNDDKDKLRESQDSQDPMDLLTNSYFIRVGINYYFLTE